MAYDGKFVGYWEGEWLGAQTTDPNAMYAALSGSSSVLAILSATSDSGLVADIGGGSAVSATLTTATSGAERPAGGWFDYPDRPRHKLEEQAQELIEDLKAATPETVEQYQDEAEDISRQLLESIDRLEKVEAERKGRLAKAQAKEDIRRLQNELIDAQLRAEVARQQMEEIDVVYIAMMMATQI